MKELLLLKRIDFWAQLLAIVVPIVLSVIMHDEAYFFMIYFSLGAVQALSCIINKIGLDKEYRDGSRVAYEVVLLILAVLGLVAMLDAFGPGGRGGNFALLYMFILLFAGFILGMWYAIISTNEMMYISKLVKRHELIK